MTPEREAEIRAVLNGDQSVGMDEALIVMSKAADDLLDEVDRLREGIEALAEMGEADGRGNSRDLARHLRAIAERDAAVAAKAWDEGFKQGGPMHDVHLDDPDAHTRNPYREGETDE